MKGIMTFLFVVVLMAVSFIFGMSYYEQEHCYVSDRGININKMIDDGRDGAETLFEDVSNLF